MNSQHQPISARDAAPAFEEGSSQADCVAILGTSPVMLIEGLMRARAGQQIVFFESSADFGGAWSSSNGLGLADVEGACHLLVNYRGVYDYLSESCGIQMETCEPQPKLLHAGRLTWFNSRRHTVRRASALLIRMGLMACVRGLEWLLVGRWKLSRAREYRFDRAARNLAKRFRQPMFASRTGRAIRYPVGGSPAMLRCLRSELESRGARFVSSNVDSIRLLPEGGVMLSLENRIETLVRKLVVSESCAIRTVESPARRREFSIRRSDHIAMILKVSGLEARALSYVELPFDPIVERVADVSAYCRSAELSHHSVLVCEIPTPDRSTAALPEPIEVLRRLQEREVLPTGIEIEETDLTTLKLRRGEQALLEHLKELQGDCLRIVPTRGDLAFAVHQNMRRWIGLGQCEASRPGLQNRSHRGENTPEPVMAATTR
jgi:hypothetical protein